MITQEKKKKRKEKQVPDDQKMKRWIEERRKPK